LGARFLPAGTEFLAELYSLVHGTKDGLFVQQKDGFPTIGLIQSGQSESSVL